MGDTRGTAAQRSARSVTDLVGDGCVVRVLDRRRRTLRTVAVDHRDAERRSELVALLTEHPATLPEGWAEHALTKNLAFRLEQDAAVDVVLGIAGTSVAAAERICGAVVAPLRTDGAPTGVLVALRDSADLPYSLHDQHLVEELATVVEQGGPDEEAAGPAFERVLEHAGAGVWVTDLDGITTYVNATVSELVGVPSCDLVGAPLEHFLDEDPQAVPNERIRAAETRDRRLRRIDRGEIWVCVSSAPYTDRAGCRQGTVSTIIDVSERKRAELELRMRAAAHEAVAELAARALGGTGLEALMDDVVEAAADILGAEYASFSEVDHRGDVVIPRAVVGWPRALLGRPVPLPRNSAARLALDADEPVLVPDYETNDELELGRVGREAAVRSTALVPVAGGAAILGVASPRAGAFSSRDRFFLNALADLFGSRWPTASPVLSASTA